MVILLTNFLLFLIPTFVILRRDKSFNINLFLLLVYAFFALTAVLVIDADIYTWTYYQRVDLSIVPYLYFNLCFWLFIIPIWKIDSNNLKIFITKQQTNILFFSSIIFFSISIAVNINDALNVADLKEAYLYGSEVRSGMKGWSVNMAKIFSPFANLLVFFFLTRDNKNLVKSLILLSLILLEGYIRMNNYGSRGIAFFLFSDIIISYLIFASLISRRVKRVVVAVVVIGLSVFISAILAISEARFGGDRMINWILSYFSEPFINFGTIFWNSPQFFYGQFTFGTEADLPDTKVPLFLFKTFVGNLYLDFRVVGSILFLILIAFIHSFFLRKVNSKTSSVAVRDVFVYFIIVKIIFAGIFTFVVFAYYEYIGWIFIYFVLLGKRKFVLLNSKEI